MQPSVTPVVIGSFFLTSLIIKYGLKWWKEKSISTQLSQCWSHSIPLQQEYFLQNRYQQVVEIADACLQLLQKLKSTVSEEQLIQILEVEFALRYQQYVSKKQLLIDEIEDLDLLLATFDQRKHLISKLQIQDQYLPLQQILVQLQFTFNPRSLCETKETYEESYQQLEKFCAKMTTQNYTFSTPWQQFLLEKCLEQRIIFGFSFEGLIKNRNTFQKDLNSYLIYFPFLSSNFKSFLYFQMTNMASNFSELEQWIQMSLDFYPKNVDALFCKVRVLTSSLEQKQTLVNQILQIHPQESFVQFYLAMELIPTENMAKKLQILETNALQSSPIHWESVESVLQLYLSDRLYWSKIDSFVSSLIANMKPREMTTTLFWLAIKHVESVMSRQQFHRMSQVVSNWMNCFSTHKQVLLLQDNNETNFLETNEILLQYETIALQLLQLHTQFTVWKELLTENQFGFPIVVDELVKKKLKQIFIEEEGECKDALIQSIVFAFTLEEKQPETMQQKLSLVKIITQLLQQNAINGLLPLVTALQKNAYGIVLITYCKWKNIPLISSSITNNSEHSLEEWFEKVEAFIALQKKKQQFEMNSQLQQLMMQKLNPSLVESQPLEEQKEEMEGEEEDTVIFNPEPLADILTMLDWKEKQEALAVQQQQQE